MEERKGRVSYVIGPDGSPLTLADLPPPSTRRWVIRRKAEVVAAVRGGLLSLDDACKRYTLTVEEFLAWQHAIECDRVQIFLSRQFQTTGAVGNTDNLMLACRKLLFDSSGGRRVVFNHQNAGHGSAWAGMADVCFHDSAQTRRALGFLVEDLVRNVAVKLNAHDDVTWYKVEAENFESIHNHNAYACIEKG